MKEHPGEACCLVVDSGYSFTHIIPHVHGKPVKSKTIRVDVGGKLLTNHLKDTISYRQLNVMDETYVVNQIKEDICFVSQNLAKDFEIAKKRGDENTIALDYVLPDFTTLKRGKIKEKTEESIEGEQTLRLTNERFTVPEVLFHPSDLGIPQMGISEAIVHTIESCPPELHSHLFKNIVLTGGNCVIPGFRDRVETDVRFMAPSIMEVGVVVPSNPITYAWHGGAAFSKEPGSSKFFVTRKEYDEHGYNIFEDKYSK
ncbi:hypothetical protein QYM36_005783 [Artemia franciscana]|nr:hypothetical protein QYM36_005783 [Artemia franciscana]